jgi:hypothetical protein
VDTGSGRFLNPGTGIALQVGMLNSSCGKQNKRTSEPQTATSLHKRFTQFYQFSTAEDLFRRFSSKLVGLVNPRGAGNFTSEERTGANPPSPSLVPLQLASLCLDCETITAAHKQCSACGSVALLSIAKTLSHPRADNLAVAAVASIHVARQADTLQST